MKALFSLRAIPMLVALVMVTSCGLGTDDEPTALSVPKDVFPLTPRKKMNSTYR